MSRSSPWAALVLVPLLRPTHAGRHDPAGHELHVDEDAICPRCLGWVAPAHIVRRTAYGPVEHECCPVRAEDVG